MTDAIALRPSSEWIPICGLNEDIGHNWKRQKLNEPSNMGNYQCSRCNIFMEVVLAPSGVITYFYDEDGDEIATDIDFI